MQIYWWFLIPAFFLLIFSDRIDRAVKANRKLKSNVGNTGFVQRPAAGIYHGCACIALCLKSETAGMDPDSWGTERNRRMFR